MKNEQAGYQKDSEAARKDYTRLMARVQEAGRVRVMVRLNMPFTPEGDLSPEKAAEQRDRIAGLQDRLIAALSTYPVTGLRKFKYTPSLAMEVDAAALRALIDSPLVLSIREELPIPPAR